MKSILSCHQHAIIWPCHQHPGIFSVLSSYFAEGCMMCTPCFLVILRTSGKHHLFAWNQEHSRIDVVSENEK
jgi:hypothetical protein